MRRKITGLLILLFVLPMYKARAQQNDARYPIIPYPASLTPAEGEFILTPATAIVVPKYLFKNEAAALDQYFVNNFGKPLRKSTAISKHSIRLKYDETIK